MTGKILYFKISATDSGATNWFELQDGGSVPSFNASNPWVQDTQAATRYARLPAGPHANIFIVDASFGVTVSTTSAEPDVESSIDNAWASSSGFFAGDSWRTQNTISGDFAAGNWTIALPLSSSTDTTGSDFKVRWRVWKSANADGTSATELTSSVQVSNQVTVSSVSNDQLTTATWNAAGITLTNDYLFFQAGFQLAVGSATTGANLLLQVGTDLSTGDVSKITTPDFSAANTNVAISGVAETSAVGTVGLSHAQPLSGVSETSAVGSVVFSASQSFALTGVSLTGRVGTVGVPISFGVTGVLGTVHLGSFVTDIGVEVATHDQPLAPMKMQYNIVSIRVDYDNFPTSFTATGALGTPSIRLDPTVTGSVQGTGHVGAVSFNIDCNASVVGIQAALALGVAYALPNTQVYPTGLEAVGYVGTPTIVYPTLAHVYVSALALDLGHVYVVSSYDVTGVSATGQLGTPGFSLGQPSSSVVGSGAVGTPSIAISSSVDVTGVEGVALVGPAVADSNTPVADSVVAYGEVGTVSFQVHSRPPKNLYTQKVDIVLVTTEDNKWRALTYSSK